MCTAVTYRTKDLYFGRNLDYEHDFGEAVTVMPRNFSLSFREKEVMDRHFAIIGMARVEDGYPLYFDGANEKGLGMAGLNFVGNAHYAPSGPGKENVASFELIPWILAQCETVAQAKVLLERTRVTDVAFRPDLPPSKLHWIIADREGAIAVEAVREGLRIYDDPVGVLTNDPSFDRQLFRLNDYMHLSPQQPRNRFAPEVELETYSRGMGALGLPGDLSSQSRFVRAAFVKLNSRSGASEMESVSQFFHILGAVEQQRGCCQVGEAFEITQYTSCCNADRGIYYYTTYDNRQITAVDMHREELEGSDLVSYPLIRQQQIRRQN